MLEPRAASKLVIRMAHRDDAGALADLANRAHAGLAGVAVRSAADLEWRYQRRPGMSEGGSVVVEDVEGHLLGYAFVSDRGDILELVVGPEGPRRDVGAALVAACERRARETGARRIRVNVPIADEDLAEALTAAGLESAPAEARLYVSGTDPQRLVQTLAGEVVEPVGLIEVELSDPLPWQPARWSIDLGETPSATPLISFRCDRRTLNDVLLLGASPWLAVGVGRIRIKPRRMTIAGIELLRSLQVRAPWFHTLGDVL